VLDHIKYIIRNKYKKIKNETIIFFTSYRQRYNKENYKEIKNYLSFISEVENLALFKIKK
jgi:hypothetical protein